MRRICIALGLAGLVLMASITGARAQMGGPFSVDAQLDAAEDSHVLKVELEIPVGHYIYAEKWAVTVAAPAELEPLDVPGSISKYDKFMEQDIDIYGQSTIFTYRIAPNDAAVLDVKVDYQGCGPEICFAPDQKRFQFELVQGGLDRAKQGVSDASEAVDNADKTAFEMESFKEIGKQSGYLNSANMIAFLDAAESGELAEGGGQSTFDGKSLWLIIILILIGGAALNLTPCVLPMIPINIAILGAGTQAKSKTRGLLLGATYGGGIAVAYGALGLLVVLTGARFGALNSSPWFNFAIAVLFIALSLSMFGVFNIDLSRFQGGSGKPIKGGRFMTAFGLGLVAALLAGACVAPVVISVLLYSATLYAAGNGAALLLPFLLGIGMALPWPFAGAGLSFLPKAGAWMEKVKYVFGVIILIAALYYGKLGYTLYMNAQPLSEAEAAAARESVEADHAGWLTSIDAAVAQARVEQKPIFIDFWAAWCKSCVKMDKTTFRDPDVLARLDDYIKLKIDADRKDDAVAYALERFIDVGLPTYVIVEE